jgi:methionine-S-sulfoxide reductase
MNVYDIFSAPVFFHHHSKLLKSRKNRTLRYMDTVCGYRKATFAAGCFWDVEAAFCKVCGVIETVVGYTGGQLADPSYEQVENGTTGHAEAVGIVYDPMVVPYEQLLDIFWAMHDPTQDIGQGDYTGSQYRSVIFFHDDEQETAALSSRDQLAILKKYGGHPIITEILPAPAFWPADECHQRFYEKCGQGYCTSRKIWE